MRPLREVLGINVHQGQHLDKALALHFRHLRLDVPWHICNPAPGVWDFEWAKRVMDRIRIAGATALLVCYATPAWKDPTIPPITGWQGPPAIPVMRPEWVPDWQEFLVHVAALWPWAEFNVATETTMRNIWQDPDDPKQNCGAQRYLDLVLRPAAQVLKPRSVKLVGPGTTMRGERESTWDEAMRHLSVFIEQGEPLLDNLDVHVYRDTGAETVSDLRRVLGRRIQRPNPRTGKPMYFAEDDYLKKIWPEDNPWLTNQHWRLYCSETGFSEPAEELQLQQWLPVLDFLEQEPFAENYERVYCYDLWGGPASILRPDGTSKLAAIEMARRLAA